jgi:predicted DNA-binding transcriptional regulator AlpA
VAAHMANSTDFPARSRYLRTPEAGRFLGLSGRTLEKHRTYGTGPTYRKIGGRVIYAVHDLEAWADLGLQNSTGEPKSQIRVAKPQDGGRAAI